MLLQDDQAAATLFGQRQQRVHLAAAEGGALGPKFVSCGAFPPAFARSYATAEESGSLDKDLARWSRVYQEDAARTVKTASNVVSKLVYFLVLLFIGWTVIKAYSGYYGMMNDLLEE